MHPTKLKIVVVHSALLCPPCRQEASVAVKSRFKSAICSVTMQRHDAHYFIKSSVPRERIDFVNFVLWIRFINVTTVRNYFPFALFSFFTTCFGLYRGHLQVCIDNDIEESPLIFNGSVVFTMSYFSVLFHFSIFKFYHVVIQLYIN
jgi:hypothetical protein